MSSYAADRRARITARPERDTAKRAMHGMGYRQKQILRLLYESEGGTLAVRDLVNGLGADHGIVYLALRGLERRGFVRRYHHGVWGVNV